MTTRHLFISGPMQSGRSAAAVAMANAMHDQGIPTVFVAPCPLAADLWRRTGRLRCKVISASPVTIGSAPMSCVVVDDAERIKEPREFILTAIQRQRTFLRPTIVWVVRQDALGEFRKLVAEVDPEGFGVDEMMAAQIGEELGAHSNDAPRSGSVVQHIKDLEAEVREIREERDRLQTQLEPVPGGDAAAFDMALARKLHPYWWDDTWLKKRHVDKGQEDYMREQLAVQAGEIRRMVVNWFAGQGCAVTLPTAQAWVLIKGYCGGEGVVITPAGDAETGSKIARAIAGDDWGVTAEPVPVMIAGTLHGTSKWFGDVSGVVKALAERPEPASLP
ncbi:hypothetical protein [Azospirillum canadense]|uniref:hypothetical protein n=1 Tax=Azospirillum canadense TaxID=403962 RepID=UPI0022271429|nr:hypothetical protein [Azospirillum canadense]MCW2242242.1 hypothetical protein [Azospirillum canadense]